MIGEGEEVSPGDACVVLAEIEFWIWRSSCGNAMRAYSDSGSAEAQKAERQKDEGKPSIHMRVSFIPADDFVLRGRMAGSVVTGSTISDFRVGK